MSQVEYFSKEGVPGRFFTCPSGYGVMSETFCADSHTKSKTREYIAEGRRFHCRFCPLGAQHAGGGCTVSSRLFGSRLCARCERSSSRLVGGRICVSCYNRERENLIGRNAKGNPLRLVRRYFPINLLVVKRGTIQVKRFDRVLSTHEAQISVLLSEQGEVYFGEL